MDVYKIASWTSHLNQQFLVIICVVRSEKTRQSFGERNNGITKTHKDFYCFRRQFIV